MSTMNYHLDLIEHDLIDQILDIVREDCRCVKEVEILPPYPMSICCRVAITRIDTGIWEWNDEVIPC